MKFHKVTIRNFLSFRDEVFSLDDQGLTLVLGENRGAGGKDSNGAGKSSLLDAFCWCLWGSTIRGIKDDEVINWRAKKDCLVTVSFEDEGNTYEVSRYRKCKDRSPHNGLRLRINEEDATQANVASTQAKITHILDMDFSTFQGMMPGSAIKLAQLTDSGIKTALEQLLRLGVFSKAQQLAKEKNKKLESRLDTLVDLVSSAESELAATKSNLSQVQDRLDKFEQERQLRLAAAEASYEDAVAKAGTVPSYTEDDVLKLHEQANKCSEELGEARVQVDKHKKIYKEYELQMSDTERSFIKKRAELNTIIKRYHKVIQDMKQLGASCPRCSQSVSDRLKESFLAEQEEQLRQHEESLEQLQADIREVHTEQGEQLAILEAAVIGAEKVYQGFKDLAKELVSAIQDVQNARKLKEVYLEAADKQKGAVESIRNEVCVVDETATWLRDSIEKLSKQLDSYESERSRLVSEQDKLAFWVEGFGSKGLRPHMLRHVTPVLNRTVQKYADIATNGDTKIEFETEKTLKNGTTKSIFSVKVVQKDGGTTYKSASAGEKARADVCIALALGDLAAARSSKSINFRFLDEPFESVDNAGLAGIVALLTSQGSNFDSVFCVTHNKQLKEYFPRTLTVVKENNESRIRR